jgi:hypothetical protein
MRILIPNRISSTKGVILGCGSRLGVVKNRWKIRSIEESKMKTCKKGYFFILVMALPLFFPNQSFPLSCAESLEGLKGVEVIVEELKSELEDFNLTATQIQKEVEVKLQNAGIQVLSKEENEKIQPLRKPYLYLKVNSYKLPWRRSSFAFCIDIALNQQVMLRENPELKKTIFYSPTWYKSEVGGVTGKDIGEIIEVVKTLTEKFIGAYQTANSKR